MLLKVNGRDKQVGPEARLSDAIVDEPYVPGATIAITRSTSSIHKETSEFEVVMSQGSIVIRLNDSRFADLWRQKIPEIIGSSIRWQSTKVLAIGSFPTELEVVRERYRYSRYDCLFTLGGFDNRSTYVMIAKIDHEGGYGTKDGRFGRVTRGRHLLRSIQEGERIVEIRPVMLELSERDAFSTTDLDLRLEDGMAVDTYAHVALDRQSPISSEHLLVLTEGKTLEITDRTSTYSANSKRMDVSLVPENVTVREEGDVTVRSEGSFNGRVYFYRKRRQLSPAHNRTGKLTLGHELLRLAPQGSFITVLTTPSRIMSIGLTQKKAGEFLGSRGLRQKRTGLADDDAIVAEQEPELTMEIREGEEVETFGIKAEKVTVWELDDVNASRTSHYMRKMTGLDHKPIGTLKVFFAHPDMPMITFVGNVKEASILMPENPFGDKSPRGQAAVTNMSRPNRGTIGIRLEGNTEFGPTGEERYGSNVFGRVVSDLELILKDVHDGDIIYLREKMEGEEFKPIVAAPPRRPTVDMDEIAEIARQAEFTQHAPPPGPFQAGPVEAIRKKPAIKKEGAKEKKGGRPRAKRPKPE